MRKAALPAQLSTILLTAMTAAAQGTFQNLDFEQATPVSANDPNQPFAVTAARALPDWTLYCGAIQQTEVLQNVVTLGSAAGDIFGPSNPSPSALPTGAPGIIDGNYTVALQAGYSESVDASVSTSLQQVGTLPVGDDSLILRAWNNGNTSFSPSFAGYNLPLVNLGATPNYMLYGADISMYAGRTGVLAFTANAQSGPSFVEIDDITFSPNAVPEPNTLALIFTGGAALALGRFRRKRR